MRDDKVLGSTVRIDCTTHDSTGALVAPSSAFTASDFRIYKDGSAAEKTTTNGITVTSPFDSIVGKHLIEIDTSNSTGDSGFWAAGSEYRVELNSAKTISSIVQSGVVVGRFALVAAGVLRPTVDGRTIAVSATTGKVTAEAVELDSAVGAQITAIETFATRITTGIVQDGAVWQFTANMLELGPAGSGGSGDASQATLLAVKAKTDLIGTAAGATTLLAAAVLEPGTITSFPETLTIGDSYTEQNGRSIQIPIVDTDGNPISSTGSLDFANASVTFTLQRSGETDSTRVITGTASFVDPPGTGTGAGAPYAVIEIPSSETAKGLKKYKYSGILTFLWSGTGTDVVSFETDTVVFDN